MSKKIEPTEAEIADRAVWREIFRVLEVVRSNVPNEELLEALLNGREKSAENVRALLALSREHFEIDGLARIEQVCKAFLGSDYEPKKQPSGYSVLEEMGWMPEEEKL